MIFAFVDVLNLFDEKLSTIDKIENDELLIAHGVELFIRRDDLIDEKVSGNKWRKLKYNVLKCIELKKTGILTFGGAYSNHLLATAAACNKAGLRSIGIVRGEELHSKSNQTLSDCHELGMHLIFISREEYHLRNEKYYQDELAVDHPNYMVVPEGGANYYGMLGCQEIMRDVESGITDVFIAQGTTTTSVGIATMIRSGTTLHVIPVLKGFDSYSEMKNILLKSGFDQDFTNDVLSEINVVSDYHFGGYGKYTEELLLFIQGFYTEHKIKLDPVYTGKVMFGIYDMIKKGMLDGKKVMFIHSGGVQGSRAIADISGIELYP